MLLEVNVDVMNMFTQSYGLTAAELTKVTSIFIYTIDIKTLHSSSNEQLILYAFGISWML
jgi:hypothetical protein